jgi:hypothetical protein
LGAVALLAGCASAGERSRAVDPGAVPPVDLSRHSVPLENVVFDTFNGGFLRLPDSSEAERRRLRDVIRPVYEPRYGERLSWLEDGDLVLGYVGGDTAYAFPLKILNVRELVNDEIDGVPILVSYCPLCGSAVIYSRELDGRTLLFGNTSALYESDLVMFDRETGSYWFQVRGEAIVGQLTGERLPVLPSTTMPWGEWKRLHPEGRVLVADGEEAFGSRYALDSFGSYEALLERGEFAFPVSRTKLDGRLPASEIVVVVEAGAAAKAYPPRLVGDAAVNDRIGDRAIVLFSRPDTASATVFAAEARGRPLTFRLEDGAFVDVQTGSAWNRAGEAVVGPLAGTRLEALPTRRAFWFSIGVSDPGIELYRP